MKLLLNLCLILLCASVVLAMNTCMGKNPATRVTYDFTPLVVDTGYYTQFKQGSDIYEFIINPCNQVGGDAMCTYACSICQEKGEYHYCCGTSDPDDFTWLPLDSNTYPGQEGITLHVSGSFYVRNSNISFICDKNKGNGAPVVLSENMNTQTFAIEWRTKYACKNQHSCEGTNPVTNVYYDFSELVVDGAYSTVFKQGRDVYDFRINPCSVADSKCRGDCSVCQETEGSNNAWCTGSSDPSDYQWSDLGTDYLYNNREGITLQLFGGEGGRNTNITFLCNNRVGDGVPMVVSEDRTSKTYVVEWETKLAC